MWAWRGAHAHSASVAGESTCESMCIGTPTPRSSGASGCCLLTCALLTMEPLLATDMPLAWGGARGGMQTKIPIAK